MQEKSIWGVELGKRWWTWQDWWKASLPPTIAEVTSEKNAQVGRKIFFHFLRKNIFRPRQLCSEDMYPGNGKWGIFKPEDGMYVNKLSGRDGLEAAAMAEYHWELLTRCCACQWKTHFSILFSVFIQELYGKHGFPILNLIIHTSPESCCHNVVGYLDNPASG